MGLLAFVGCEHYGRVLLRHDARLAPTWSGESAIAEQS